MLDWMEALKLALVPSVLVSNFIGTAVGIIIGALPGLTSTMGVALAVPLTYGMAPASGFAMLCGIYCGSVYGGAITAILINTPGTPAGAATTLDGYPMAQKGRAVEALGIAAISSFLGGLFSVVVLSFCAPALAKVALEFGPAEYFAVMAFGITIISSISGKSMSRGLFAGLLGMFLGCIGTDPLTDYPRFADGIPGLYGGIQIVPCLIGLFSFPQAIDMIVKKAKESHMNALSGKVPPIREFAKRWINLLRSAVIGTFVGILPGAGTSIATFLAYNEAMRFSKHKEEFGTGCIDGVIATETSNNAVVGGSLVPLLTLGIPGNAVSAIFLGALTIQGLKPGPFLFQEQAPLIYSLFLSLGIAHLFFLIIGLSGVRIFPRILKLSPTILSGGILILGTVGSFALRNEPFDIWVVLAFGLLGYFLKMIKTPTAPVVLGFILGPMIEANFEQAMLIGDGKWSFFFAKPISAAFIVLAVISFITPFILRLRKTRNAAALAEEANANEEEEL